MLCVAGVIGGKKLLTDCWLSSAPPEGDRVPRGERRSSTINLCATSSFVVVSRIVVDVSVVGVVFVVVIVIVGSIIHQRSQRRLA